MMIMVADYVLDDLILVLVSFKICNYYYGPDEIRGVGRTTHTLY